MAGTVPLYFVTDIQRSLAYYRGVLGFQVEATFTNPEGGDDLVWASLSYGEAGVMLASFQVTDREASPPDTLGLGVWAYIEVKDADAYYETVSDRGARIAKPIGTMDYGLREFRVKDPDGYVLAFYHPVEEGTHGRP